MWLKIKAVFISVDKRANTKVSSYVNLMSRTVGADLRVGPFNAIKLRISRFQ